MQPNDAMKEMLRGKLTIDFPRITATQNVPVNPITYEGPGEIRLDEDGVLICKFYAKAKSAAALFQGISSSDPGTLYKNEDYYEIVASDVMGNFWHSPRELIVLSSVALGTMDAVISAKLSNISSKTGGKSGSETLKLVFANQDWQEWRALGGEWTLGAPFTGYDFKVSERERSHVCVEVSTRARLPEDFSMRLNEALSFVLSDTLVVRTSRLSTTTGTTTTLRSVSSRPRVSNQRFSPLELRSGDNSAFARDLLGRYLKFAQLDGEPGLWHDCSAHLAHARQASANSLDAWTVGVCVALEGVASHIPAKLPRADAVKVERIIATAERLLGVFNVPMHLKQRVTGLLGQLKNIRVKDRLDPLIDSGVLPKDYYKAWSEARNRGVHTAKLSEKDFTDPKLQLAITRLLKTQTMTHLLVFRLIGYSGPYADYGSIGFPERRA